MRHLTQPTKPHTKEALACYYLIESPSLACEYGIITPGRAQYATFKWTQDLKIWVINIYEYNKTGSRASLWNQMRRFQLPPAHCILAKDFNAIEYLEDKQGGTPTTGRGQQEIMAWTNLLLHQVVTDCFSLNNFWKINKTYSWDNGKIPPWNICTWIDRIYLPPKLNKLGGIIRIWSSMPHISDHTPVFTKIVPNLPWIPKTSRFNTLLLKEKESTQLLLTT